MVLIFLQEFATQLAPVPSLAERLPLRELAILRHSRLCLWSVVTLWLWLWQSAPLP